MAKAITDLMVERMRPLEVRTEVSDALIPALRLVLQPSGAKSWAVRTRVDGKTLKVTLGQPPIMRVADARREAERVILAARAGDDPRQIKAKEAAAKNEAAKAAEVATVARRLKEWLDRDQSQNRSLAEVRRLIEKDVTPTWGNRPISSITKRDVVELLDAVGDRAPIVANRLRAHLRRFFNWLAARDVVSVNPVQHVEAVAKERTRDRVLADDELAAVWRAAGEVGVYGLGIRLLIATGARRDEIFEARRDEVDGPWLDLPAGRAKTAQRRRIALHALAMGAIEAMPSRGGYLVSTDGGETHFRDFTKAKRRLDTAIAAQVGEPIAPWVVHDLRRSVATGMQRLGERLEVIEAVLGHAGSRAGIVGVYQRHGFDLEAAAALERWDAHLRAITSTRRLKVVA